MVELKEQEKTIMKERSGIVIKSGKKAKTSIVTLAALTSMLCLSTVLFSSCTARNAAVLSSGESQQTQNTSTSAAATAVAGNYTNEVKNIREIVEHFGRVLKNVSLLASDAEIIKSMETNYAEYITPDLLANWEGNPSVRAAGRLTSSPWPDRIEISGIKKNAGNSYAVSGTLIEVTSLEVQSGSIASTRSVEIKVVLYNGKWLIS